MYFRVTKPVNVKILLYGGKGLVLACLDFLKMNEIIEFFCITDFINTPQEVFKLILLGMLNNFH